MSDADQKDGENFARRMRGMIEGYIDGAADPQDFWAGLFGGLSGIAVRSIGASAAKIIADAAADAAKELGNANQQ